MLSSAGVTSQETCTSREESLQVFELLAMESLISAYGLGLKCLNTYCSLSYTSASVLLFGIFMLFGYFAPDRMLTFAIACPCVSVGFCLFVCTLAYLENQRPNFSKFSVRYLWQWLSPPLMTLQFRFCGWRHFLYNEANGPASKMTHAFHPVRQVTAAGRSLPSLTASCSLLETN